MLQKFVILLSFSILPKINVLNASSLFPLWHRPTQHFQFPPPEITSERIEKKTHLSSREIHNRMPCPFEWTCDSRYVVMIDSLIDCKGRIEMLFSISNRISITCLYKSEMLFICWVLRCHSSAGCDELLVMYSNTMCELLIPFWRFGIDLAGWLSMCVSVVYAISCSACMAFLTSILKVATSWWSVDTCVSKRSIELRRLDVGFSSFITSGSSSFSSSELLDSKGFFVLRVLTGLLLTLDPRDFWDFSLRAIKVWRLWMKSSEEQLFFEFWFYMACSQSWRIEWWPR